MKDVTKVFQVLLALSVSMLGQGTAIADVITYYHTDISGSPVAGSDVSGNIVWREAYTPYGERRLEQASSGGNRRWFTGQPHEEFSGLTYMGARHYDPMIGRFMGVDPVRPNSSNQFGFNRYAYANDNPFSYTDPTGLATECNAHTCTITADTFKPSKSSGATIRASVEGKGVTDVGQREVTEAKTKFKIKVEKTGVLSQGPDGNLSVFPVEPKATTSSSRADTATFMIDPKTDVAAIHAHIDGRSDGMVDSPSDNGGYGDTVALKYGVPEATI